MHILSFGAKLVGVGLAVWLLSRAIRTSHPLDRTASLLRWSIVFAAAATYLLSLEKLLRLPDLALWVAILSFTLFFFLPDLSYYLVMGFRCSVLKIRRHRRYE
jgi:hypothetical protein